MEKDSNIEFTEKGEPIYRAGAEAKDVNGESVDSSSFSFVQQDKAIHDTKFVTRPTTFMKDAFHRFRKNKSSVVGGIILGTLFVLALILPLAMTSVDITQTHDYETHLPCKLFAAGTGWWDGTKTSKNVIYPYVYDFDDENNVFPVKDENGNYMLNDATAETYPELADIVKVENVKNQYYNHSLEGGEGGFVALVDNPHEEQISTYFYHYPVKFDVTNNKYSFTFELGSLNNDTYVSPEYKLIAINSDGTMVSLTDYTSNYGEAKEIPVGASITPHETFTYSLNDLIAGKSVNTSKEFSVGFMFKSDSSKQAAFYVKSFELTGKTKADADLSKVQRRILANRSFGTDTSTIADANDCVLQQATNKDGTKNESYWTSNPDQRLEAHDTFSVLCDITYDLYQCTYGLKNNIEVSQDTIDKWIKNKELEFDYVNAYATGDYEYTVTDAGKNDKQFYITQIQKITLDNNSGKDIYTFYCQVTMYKYLGYDNIPLHLFGTDNKGKDLLKYVFSGLRTSLLLGIIVSIINILIGIIWGSISGYFGGWVDITMERLTDVLGGIPWIVLMTVLTIKLGPTFFVFVLALCLTGWIGTASTTRSQFYRYRDREYVLAAKTLGAKPGRLIFQHILPNAIGTIVTRSILMIPSTIFSEATISYLGLGFSNLDSLGVILSTNQKFLSTYPSELVFPAVIISLLMICFNLFGNGLRDAFNPSLKGED